MSDSSVDEEVREKMSNPRDFRWPQEPWYARQRNVSRDESHSDLAAGQAHGKIGDSASFGEKFGLTGKGEAGIVHLLF